MSPRTESFDVVIVGAGQAGLAASYELTGRGVEHVVLERGAIGESWRSQRWDSFHLNTPNWANSLVGLDFDDGAPHGFHHRDRLVEYFERYASSFGLPVREHTAVERLERLHDGHFRLHANGTVFAAQAVILATGTMSRPRTPGMAGNLPDDVDSVHAGAYRGPSALRDGAVVVVGSAQSGCQIAEDLLEGGRRVFVCTGRVARVPRVHRGRDIVAWWRDMGFLDVPLEELPDPALQFAAQPQVSGTRGGHTVSLQSLARDGATLLGHAAGIEGRTLRLRKDLRENIAFADERAAMFRQAVDEFIEREGIDAPPADPDPNEPPLPDLGDSSEWATLDLDRHDVHTFVWCTGFEADWSWVDVDAFDDDGRPRHVGGASECRGLYFVGFPWLRKRKSGILHGVSEDAAHVVEHLATHVLTTSP